MKITKKQMILYVTYILINLGTLTYAIFRASSMISFKTYEILGMYGLQFYYSIRYIQDNLSSKTNKETGLNIVVFGLETELVLTLCYVLSIIKLK